MEGIEHYLNTFANFMWSEPLIILLVGGGVYFALILKLRPYLYFGHAVKLIFKQPQDENSKGGGQLSHSQSLATALSATVGLGNLAGVAIALSVGGPGSIFWMWVTALVGVATKFFTGTLAVMYRGVGSDGQMKGGPMYVVKEGMPPIFHFLAPWFAMACMIGTVPIFQSNQLISMLANSAGFEPTGTSTWPAIFAIPVGVTIAILCGWVIIGKIRRLGRVTERLVPAMVLLYIGFAILAMVENFENILPAFQKIFTEAFSMDAGFGGLLGTVMIGVRRGAFSNEAGIGTESLAHGAAKTAEPIREGLVAMLGPVIDTLIVCTITALLILVTGVDLSNNNDGILITKAAFVSVAPTIGPPLLLILVCMLSFSTMISFWYYGSHSLEYLTGSATKYQGFFTLFYLSLIAISGIFSLSAINGLIIGFYALMAIPTMISALWLSPKVLKATDEYFAKLKKQEELN